VGIDEPEEREHSVLIFAAVAILVLGLLLLIARLIAGQQSADNAQAYQPSPRETLGGAPAVLAAPYAVEYGPKQPPLPLSAPPEIGARAYAIVDRACGAVIWGKDEHERLAPASLTKIVTALVVEKRAKLTDMVDVNVSGRQMAARGSSVMGVEPGMRLSVEDLLHGLFLPSGNDAALALAGYMGGGSVNNFVDLMNEEAQRLRMLDTHFTNPHGLDSRGLYSSAYDMALAGRALLDDPYLARLSSTPEYEPAWDGPALRNGNKLLQMYPGAFGVKIGFTTNAQQTIVAAAERNGRQIIVSLFGTETRYLDSIALFDWAFSQAPSACAASN
jgi:D-alanyl-D-alanine carboxypeptidase